MLPVISNAFKKFSIGFLLFVSVWNLLKFPYLLNFYSDGDKDYRERGLELSIHMGHWVEVRAWGWFRRMCGRTTSSESKWSTCGFMEWDMVLDLTFLHLPALLLPRLS